MFRPRKMFGFMLALVAAAGLQAQTAPELFKQGNIRIAEGKLDEAAADFTAAIAQQADYPEAYANRGYVKRLQGDLPGAIADYTKAIALNPKLSPPYNHRGVARAFQGELDPAIADYTQALALNPKYSEASLNRAYAHIGRQDWKAAEADLRRYFAANRGDPDFPRFYLWLVRVRLGEKTEADKELALYLSRPRSAQDRWPVQVGEFLLGKTVEKDFLASITAVDEEAQRGKLCEAWYFAGAKRLLAGDSAGARESFQQCVATGRKDFIEYQLAEAELKVLGK